MRSFIIYTVQNFELTLTEEIHRRGVKHGPKKHTFLFSRPTMLWLTDVLCAETNTCIKCKAVLPLNRQATLPCHSYFVG